MDGRLKFVKLLYFCIACLPIKRKSASFNFWLDRQMQTSYMEVFALAPLIAYWESLLMTWILGRCPSPMQAEVLISWGFFYYSAQQNTQTYLANADLLSKCPCNYSSVSHFKFSPPPHCKGYAIKALLPRRSCSSVPDCSFALNLDGVSFLLIWKCSVLMIWLIFKMTCHFTLISGGKINSEQNELFSVFIWILARFTKVHGKFLLCAFGSTLLMEQ